MIPIMETLARIGGGKLLAELGDELREVVAGVHASDKPGELVVRIKVRPVESARTMVGVTYELNAKVPTLPADATLFYPDPAGDLHRQHPSQRDAFDEAHEG